MRSTQISLGSYSISRGHGSTEVIGKNKVHLELFLAGIEIALRSIHELIPLRLEPDAPAKDGKVVKFFEIGLGHLDGSTLMDKMKQQ